MAKKITGIAAHPAREELSRYAYDAPEGTWKAQLDHKAWGKSQNLFCYFTEIASGDKYRLSVFSRSDYAPCEVEVAMREQEIGSILQIKSGKTRNGTPKFLHAKLDS